MSSLSSPLLLLIFVLSAGAIWVAGVKLSNTTDTLADRLHLGQALGGLILLAIATNLPELAITASAAFSHQLEVAVGNILGGIALQTVVLAALDGAGVRPRKPLTYMSASLPLVLEGASVVAILAVVVMGTQLPEGASFLRVGPASVGIVVVWIVGLFLIQRSQTNLPWSNSGNAPDSQVKPAGHSKKDKTQKVSKQSTLRVALVFGAAAVVTLIAGVLLEKSGDVFFSRQGLSGLFFGATVLALATSLPELSTGITSTRLGDYKLAVSDIFGGNSFLPVLFVMADLISGQSSLPSAKAGDVYLTALGILLTLVYMTGLIFRPQRQYFRLGPDSLAVLAIYIVGIVGLAVI